MTAGICSVFPATERATVMAGPLLLRGMLAGLLAACFAALFAAVFGEPAITQAIAFEAARAAASGEAPEPEIVSRAVQSSIGLIVAAAAYGAAYGGLFALVFAAAWGRVGRIGARELAGLLAVAGFVAVVLVPGLKYPPNPPSVGEPETIGLRTAVYFEMVLLSIASAALACLAGLRLKRRHGAWPAWIAGAALFVALVSLLQAMLPTMDEVPGDFPATLLWRLRLAAFGTQAVLWCALGLVFGALAERLLLRARYGRSLCVT